MQLEGKRIVLTGGQGGIGSALARTLRQRGGRVEIIGRSDGDGVTRCDLADPRAVEILCAGLARHDVDILVNLAGLMFFGHTPDQKPEHLAAMMQVNLQTPIRLAQAVLPRMLARERGQIVNIGSVFGAIPFPHFAAYSATKAAIRAFSEALRREYAGTGIAVTHIAPRAVKTPMNAGAIATLHRRTRTNADAPEEIAPLIADAIVAERANMTIGMPESLFARINALVPSLIDSALSGKRDIANDVLRQGAHG